MNKQILAIGYYHHNQTIILTGENTNNEQLAILLENYYRQIEKSITEVRDNLPRELFKEEKDFLGYTVETCEALQPLYDFINSFEIDIEMLKGEK